MSLSSSQARLIALTARMNDIEYQGQQINQERTTLSNQVNALYNSLLDMSVPTPPSTSDYTTIQYTCNIGPIRYTVGTVTPDRHTDSSREYYSVNLNYERTGEYLTPLTSRHFVQDSSGTWHVGSADANTVLQELSATNLPIIPEDMEGFINAIKNYFPEYEDDTPEDIKSEFYVYFTQDGQSPIPHFVRKSDIQSFAGNEGYAKAYDYLPNGTFNGVRHYDACTLTFNEQGLISNIGLPVYDGNTLAGHDDFALTATRVTNQEAYNDAFNDYETAKYKYDKKQQEINAKTSIIQRQDKNLELKLTRLDNERNAVKTEIDAVKKVVQDATESGFKTFSG